MNTSTKHMMSVVTLRVIYTNLHYLCISGQNGKFWSLNMLLIHSIIPIQLWVAVMPQRLATFVDQLGWINQMEVSNDLQN